MSLFIQTVAILEGGIGHPEIRRLLIHRRDKILFTAAHKLRQRDSRVIGGGNGGRLDHIIHAHLFALFEPDIGAAHRSGVSGCGHNIVHMDLAAVDRLHHERQRHDLGDGSAGARFMRIFLKKNFA